MTPASLSPDRADNTAPIAMECDAPHPRVVGELPRELNGTLFRNGPNPQFQHPGAHWFFGDGMLHAFMLEDGRARYRNRWVRTAHWQAENTAGRRLFDGFGRDASGTRSGLAADEGAANTNVIWHAGRLLALEEAHLPIEIDPATLATRGVQSFGNGLKGPFTAHPKTDPVTGELVFFGYNASGPFSTGMSCGVLDAQGRVTRFERFDAPYASMVHDFMVTARHVLLPILPLTGSMPRAMRGAPPYAWEPAMGARIGVMPRGGSAADLRWFEGEACYVFHVMNAWEEGDLLHADVMRYDEPPLFPHVDGRPTDPARSTARLCRWTFDLASSGSGFRQQDLDDLPGEFPRFDERYAGLAYRHGWFACERPGEPGTGQGGLAHWDAARGQRAGTYLLPLGDKVSEPVFVPRRADAPEGDGWLLATVFRGAEHRSDLAVFDGQAIGDGPLATVQLSHRVPAGFHGNWVASDAISPAMAQAAMTGITPAL